MERNEMIGVINGMCNRYLKTGFISTLEDAKILCEVFDRFRNINYTNDDEYSNDIMYFYNLAVSLHNNGHTTLEESYSIYNALLSADGVDFVEVNESVDEETVKVEPIKIKRRDISKVENVEDDISEIEA
jgi:hypothetical protein